MANPKVAGTTPIRVEVEAGKKYAWCTCGESRNSLSVMALTKAASLLRS